MIFKINTIPHTMFAAIHLRDQLIKLGHIAALVDNINLNEECIYILYQVSRFTIFPKRYIVMQTETHLSHWFNDSYFQKLKNAICVWEYNAVNITYDKYNNKIAVISPGLNIQPKIEKDIPVLFYGWVDGSERRTRILNEIKKILDNDFLIIINTTGPKMWDILSRTKVVINIHYIENQPLELFRIYEAMSFRCHIISERSPNEEFNAINFENDPSQICGKATELLDKEFYDELSCYENTKEIKEALNLI